MLVGARLGGEDQYTSGDSVPELRVSGGPQQPRGIGRAERSL